MTSRGAAGPLKNNPTPGGCITISSWINYPASSQPWATVWRSRQTPQPLNTKGRPSGWQSPDDWKKTLAMMAEAGQAKADANINDFFTNDLVKS